MSYSEPSDYRDKKWEERYKVWKANKEPREKPTPTHPSPYSAKAKEKPILGTSTRVPRYQRILNRNEISPTAPISRSASAPTKSFAKSISNTTSSVSSRPSSSQPSGIQIIEDDESAEHSGEGSENGANGNKPAKSSFWSSLFSIFKSDKAEEAGKVGEVEEVGEVEKASN